jgi:hypothetical protein
MTVTAAADATLGVHPIMITGTGAGGLVKTTTFTLTVEKAPVPVPFDFSLAVAPTAATVVQGKATIATVTATHLAGPTENVTLTAAPLPHGITVTFVPPVGTPAFSSNMTVTAAADATLGVHTVTITGTGAGGLVRTTTFTLTVEKAPVPVPFDFSLAVTPTAATVVQGKTTTATVNATHLAGPTENVTLTAAPLPHGITVTFVPAVGKPTFSSTMAIATTANATLGVHLITITGTGAGGLVKTTTFTLTVVAPPPPLVYTLTMAVVGGGTTVPAVGTHTFDAYTTVTITVTAAAGWAFSHWVGDVADAAVPTTTVTMDAHKTVTAHFAWVVVLPPPVHILTMAVVGEGTTAPPVGTHTFYAHTVVSITATPAAGWVFSHWVGDVAAPAFPTTTVTMDAHKSVTAHFAWVVVPPPARYFLTVTVDPPVSGTVSLSPPQPAAGYLAGTAVTLTATPATNWRFERWSGDVTGTVPATTVTMDAHKSITAHFVLVPVVPPPVVVPPPPPPAEVVEEIGGIPPEVLIPEEIIKHIEEIPLEEAIEIAEGVEIARAVEIAEEVGIERAIVVTERVSIERAVGITEGVSIERAVEITQKLSIGRAAKIVDKVVIERAVEIIEKVNLDRAARIIDKIAVMEGTIYRAVEILEKVSLKRATAIIERLSMETAVEIAKRLSIERASGIVEKASLERASEIIKGVPLERATEILTVIEKVSPERWELLPRPIFEIGDLLIEPLKVMIGVKVTISAEAANVGELKGKRSISLKVEEVVLETKEVELGAGETARVEFKVVKMEPATYPVEIEGLTGVFTVVLPPPPTIERVVPASGIQGARIDAVITGAHFTGATVVSFGAGITVNRFSVISPTRIEANISIAADARAGPRDVSVTTPGGKGTLPGGFTVRDVARPRVIATSPGARATGVSVRVAISATFSEDMDPATINAATFTLTRDATRVAGRVTYDPATRTATFIPHEDLAYGTEYTATITTGARDLAGNGLVEFNWSFTTRPAPPDLAPIVEGVVTVAGAAFFVALIVYALITAP